jgi:hypothetical protein
MGQRFLSKQQLNEFFYQHQRGHRKAYEGNYQNLPIIIYCNFSLSQYDTYFAQLYTNFFKWLDKSLWYESWSNVFGLYLSAQRLMIYVFVIDEMEKKLYRVCFLRRVFQSLLISSHLALFNLQVNRLCYYNIDK